MSGYSCPYCKVSLPTFASARAHVSRDCPRLAALGFDLEVKVLRGDISIDDAELAQSQRPAIIL